MFHAIASFLTRRQFRPTLWPTLGLIVLVAATLSLGNWQRQRAAQKAALQTQFDLAAREPPMQLALVRTASDAARWRFHLVRASGEFDARAQVLIDNKVHAGQPGYHVVTPLKLTDGNYVLVDRGWVRAGPRRAELPQVPPPTGSVTVEGRLDLPPQRYLELGADNATGPVRQNLDIARLATASGLPLLPYIVEQTGESPAGLVRDWAVPDFGIEQHRSYMLQWYSLGLLGCVLWVGLNWRARPA
jgi:surfeit locus 1 family protein